MGLLQDLRFAARSLARGTGFTAVALIMLGLAIGANTAIFQMIDALLLRELPVREPSRLVRLDEPSFSYPTFLSLQSQLAGSQPAAVLIATTIATTIAACWLPARWIVRAAPAASLRYE